MEVKKQTLRTTVPVIRLETLNHCQARSLLVITYLVVIAAIIFGLFEPEEMYDKLVYSGSYCSEQQFSACTQVGSAPSVFGASVTPNGTCWQTILNFSPEKLYFSVYLDAAHNLTLLSGQISIDMQVFVSVSWRTR